MFKSIKLVMLFLIAMFYFIGCTMPEPQQQQSDSGVEKASIVLKTDASGKTTEQRNVIGKLERDNDVGSVKHLYW